MARLLSKVKNENSYLKYFQNGPGIGNGAFGTILKVVSLRTNQVVAAIKCVTLEGRSPRIVANTKQEVPFVFGN